MPGRRDALCAAAEAVLAVEAAALSSGSPDTVATTGVCRVHPGAINSIPDRVTLEIDVRDIDLGRRDRVVDAIREAIDAIAARRQVAAVVECLNADPPATMAGVVVEAIRAACGDAGPREPAHDQPRLSRLALHGPDRADRDDLHPVQGTGSAIGPTNRARPRRSPAASRSWR